jgi:ATP-dependent Lon protease
MIFRSDKKDDRESTGGATRVPLLPLRDIIVFPHMVVPLFVGRQRSIKALEEATQKQSPIFMSSQKDAKTNEPTEEDIYKIGTLGTVVQMLKLPDGTVKVLIEGKKRAKIVRFINNPDFFLAEVEDAQEIVERNPEVEALTREVHTTFENYVKLKKKIPPEMVMSVSSIDDPGRLADTIVAHLGIKIEDRQNLLETFNATERLEKVLGHMRNSRSRAAHSFPSQEANGALAERVLSE